MMRALAIKKHNKKGNNSRYMGVERWRKQRKSTKTRKKERERKREKKREREGKGKKRGHTRRQALLQLLGLVRVAQHQRVQVAPAAHLELDRRRLGAAFDASRYMGKSRKRKQRIC